MKPEDKIDMMLAEAMRDTWAERFGSHNVTFENFLKTFQADVLEFELEMRRRGKEPDLTKVRRLLGQLAKANKEVRRILVTVARAQDL